MYRLDTLHDRQSSQFLLYVGRLLNANARDVRLRKFRSKSFSVRIPGQGERESGVNVNRHSDRKANGFSQGPGILLTMSSE